MIDITKQRVVLIGGAGFIGHHLALELKKRGAQVFVIDGLEVNNLLSFVARPTLPNRDIYLQFIQQRLKLLEGAGTPLIVQDARDYLALGNRLREIDPHVVVHLAAVAHANISNKDPFTTFDHSLRTLENALDSCRESNRHFIYFSSSMIYGNFKTETVTEQSPCEPIGIYGALKFAGEKMVIAYNQVFNVPYTIVRPSALYGERCVSCRVGQIFVENALKRLAVNVSGDGSDRLDFTYVGDLVNGIVKVIENESSRGETFNLTYGQSRSIAEMAEILRDSFPDIEVRYHPVDRLTPTRGTLSVEKAKKLLGYAPEYPLERGFVKYISWYRDMASYLTTSSQWDTLSPRDRLPSGEFGDERIV